MREKLYPILAVSLAILIGSISALQVNDWEAGLEQNCKEKYETAAFHEMTCVNYGIAKDDVLQAVRENQPATTNEISSYTNLTSQATEAVLHRLRDERYVFSEDRIWKGEVWKIWNVTQRPDGIPNSTAGDWH